ncbi:hypothetical protein MMC18_006739 [Xylographa bjoerkii]|nr:hypothetical protein [Xylographa bjoerkii]
MTSPRTPPLLAPYVALPQPSSLTLVTGVLGATTNWLMLSILGANLANIDRDDRGITDVRTVGGERDQEEDRVRVVLVSFSRDWTFWKGEGVRMGIDFVRHLKSRRVTFIDGLSELFTNTNTPQTTNSDVESGQRVLRDSALDVVERTVLDAIRYSKHEKSSLGRKEILLFLDGLDLYIAATGRSAQEVNDMLGEWREVRSATLLATSNPCRNTNGARNCANSASVFKQVFATIIATAADSPLIQSPITSLEMAHTAFVVGLAHEARLVMSVRGLDTGVARDISGVIRVTKVCGRLKADEHVQASEISKAGALEEKEMLFFISGDGVIKVWERGA